MVYSNPEFFALFGLTWALYSLSSSYRARFSILLTASLVFYGWAGLFDGLIFLLVILISWLAVWGSERRPAWKGVLIPAGIVVITAHLLVWKYASWLTGQVQEVWPGFLGGREVYLPLPVGISFFTLQSVAYLVDYSRGTCGFVGLAEYALFKSFFAQLLAGPIVRGRQLFPQLEELPRPSREQVSLGLSLFALGFFKKVAIADRVAYHVDVVFAAPEQYGRLALLKAVAGYTVQIWADFSGYTDMGRGAAHLLGVRLPENFLSPYLSRTPSEFWKRWHITLSSWIADYIFTPLAMRSRALGAQGLFFFSAVLTMLIAGVWHGAGWNFALFGLYHGLLLVLSQRGLLPRDAAPVGSWRARAQMLVMLPLVMGGWLLFRVESLARLGAYLRGLACGAAGLETPSSGRSVWVLFAFTLALQAALYYDFEKKSWVWLERLKPREEALTPMTGALAGAALALLMAAALLLRPAAARGFIYFQF